jgi:SAM-dependent methyltransferase
MAALAALALDFDGPFVAQVVDGRRVLRGTLHVAAPVVFGPHVRVRLDAEGVKPLESDSGETVPLAWLPRGRYRVDILVPDSFPAGRARYGVEVRHHEAMADVGAGHASGEVKLPASASGVTALAWTIDSIAPTPPVSSLAWRKGHADWFFRHFDHATWVVVSYLLDNSPLLKGRILDVGCGDGITDLGIALRTGCEELVGIDPFRGYERLPEILADKHLPTDTIPPNLRFMAESANALPFPDDRFDVVVSWGSLEHIAGGYDKALAEIRRVLRPGGLFFVHPGLYYSNVGSHLGEFSREPFVHLKKPLDELKRLVLGTKPDYMDRAGEFATPEQYWQWFRELNPITVSRFEQELRALDFEPWRAALRTEDLIEYTPEIQKYPIQDLAIGELYLSCISRKGASR